MDPKQAVPVEPNLSQDEIDLLLRKLPNSTWFGSTSGPVSTLLEATGTKLRPSST